MNIGLKISKIRKSLHISQSALAEKCGYANKSTISMIESGKVNLDQNHIRVFADALGVSVQELLDIEPDAVQMEVIGEVSCGFGGSVILSHGGDTMSIPSEWLHNQPSDNFFLLKCKGDSMYPDIKDGDFVLVKKQSTCDYSGQIAVCFYNQESATLKEIRYGDGWIEMIPYNRQYPSHKVTGEDLNRTYILGVALRVIRTFEQ